MTGFVGRRHKSLSVIPAKAGIQAVAGRKTCRSRSGSFLVEINTDALISVVRVFF
jgi:hypothetical protein